MSNKLNRCLTPNQIKKITHFIIDKKKYNKNTIDDNSKKDKDSKNEKIQNFCIFFIIEKFNIWDYNELLKKKKELNTKSIRLIFNCLQLLDGYEISHKDLMEIYQYVLVSEKNNSICLQNGGDCGDCGGGCGGACNGKTGWF